MLVADDAISDEEIAAQVGVTRFTICRWRKQPEFMARVQHHMDRMAAAIEAEGIANRRNRVAALTDRWDRMQRVIEARAADLKEVPGGDTGLLVRQLKSIGFGENNTVIEEYAVDTGLLRELRAHEEQAAKELGQWVERSDQKVDASQQFIQALRMFGRGNSTA